jgi:hypothetical protein
MVGITNDFHLELTVLMIASFPLRPSCLENKHSAKKPKIFANVPLDSTTFSRYSCEIMHHSIHGSA